MVMTKECYCDQNTTHAFTGCRPIGSSVIPAREKAALTAYKHKPASSPSG
jgi:hypothetical protein